jgi:hypothetical protein
VSEAAKKQLRILDKIMMKGRQQPTELWTMDMIFDR